jgi:hypothetical protein
MRWLLLLAALAMPIISWLSQDAAFGPDNGTISDRYPTLLVAAGYAFAVWGLIFLLDVVFAIWQLRRKAVVPARVRPLVVAGFALTALWMPVFSQQVFWLALLIIWAALGCLLTATLISVRAAGRERPPLVVTVPLSLHAGWLSLAAFLNTAQVIVAYRWLDTGDMLAWSLALFAAAAALLLVANHRMRGNIAYATVALWGLAAVYIKQSQASLPGADIAAWTAVGIAIVLAAQTLWLRVRRSD